MHVSKGYVCVVFVEGWGWWGGRLAGGVASGIFGV